MADWQKELFGTAYKSSKTKAAAEKRKNTMSRKDVIKQATYDKAMTSSVKDYASRNNIQYSDKLKTAAEFYFKNKDVGEKFREQSEKESSRRQANEYRSSINFRTQEKNQFKVDDYNDMRKKLGYSEDPNVTKKKYESLKSTFERMQEFKNKQGNSEPTSSKEVGFSLDKTIDKGISKLKGLIQKVKPISKKVEDTLNLDDLSKSKAAQVLYQASGLKNKVDSGKLVAKGSIEGMDKVDQYGGASSIRNVLSDATDDKNQSGKDYIKAVKEGFTGKRRATGEEIAKNLNLTESKYGNKAIGFGIEVLADPTNLVGAGAYKVGAKAFKGASKLGKIAKATKTVEEVANKPLKEVNELTNANTQLKPVEPVQKVTEPIKTMTETSVKSEVTKTPEKKSFLIQSKPFNYEAERKQLELMHKTDKDNFANKNSNEINAIRSIRESEMKKQMEQEMEFEGHEQLAKEYERLRKDLPKRLNIPAENFNDFAVNLPKHLVSAKNSGKGEDIYKLADDMGYNNVDKLVNYVNNAYESHKIVKAGKNKFITQQVSGHPDDVLEEMYKQTQSAQEFDKKYKDLEFKQGESIKSQVTQQSPFNVLTQAPTRTQRLSTAIEKAKQSNESSHIQEVIEHTNNLIKELDSKHINDEELQGIKEDLKAQVGLKMNLQLFGAAPEKINEMLSKIARINEQAERLMQTRKGHLELEKMTPEQKIEHYIQKQQANSDYLQSKLDEIDELLESPFGDGLNGSVSELKNNLEAKLHKSNKAVDAASEIRGSLSELQNRKDVHSISTALIKPMRLFEKVFGKDSDLHKGLFNGQQEARVLHQELNNTDHDIIKNVESLIGKKKKDSALLQDFGEKNLLKYRGIDPTGMSRKEIEQVNLRILQEIKPDTWQNFVDADNMARSFYNSKIERYNEVMQQTYPKDVTKLIQKRNDYYHHFNEMGEGLAQILNRLKHQKETKISPELEGLSKVTKPMTQWVGQKMARMGGAYTSDAIGGMVKTSMDLNKAIAWTPQVGKLRSYKQVLSMATEHTANLNNIVRVMDNYANKLANKSGDMDRWIGDNAMGRIGLSILNSTSNIVKNNLLSHSLRVVLAQGLSIPHGFAAAKTENIIKGLPNTMEYLMKNNGPASKSPFLKERLGTKDFEDFNHSVTSKIIKSGHILPSLVDKVTVPMYWNGIYAERLAANKQYLQNGVIPKWLEKQLIDETDKLTSEIVGGRGIGDKSFAQESKVYGVLDPFQLEPQSQWIAMSRMFGGLKEGIKNKDLKQLAGSSRKVAEWGIYSWLVGEAFQYMTGSDAALNPVEDVKKGIEEGTTLGEKTGYTTRNLVGDFATSGGVPLVQSLANITGLAKNGKKIFGKDDPFRYAQGGIVAAKPIDEMINGNGIIPENADFLGSSLLRHLPTSVIFPAGEGAIERGIKGFRASEEGGVYSKSNPSQMLYPVGDDLPTRLKSIFMGTNATKNAQAYFDKNTTPLSEKQTFEVLQRMSPKERELAWKEIMNNRGKGKKTKPSTEALNKLRRENIEKSKQN